MNRYQIIEACARAAHEMNRVYCIALGDTSQVPWEETSDEFKDSSIKGAEGALAGNTPEQSHESWLAHRIEHGWVYGPVKDQNAKPPTHPCLVPYAELPEAQRKKDEIFVKTVRTMARAFGYPLPPSKMRYQIWVDESRECSLLFNLDKDGNIDAASQATIDRHKLRLYESFEGTRDEASKRHDAVSLKEMPPEPAAGLPFFDPVAWHGPDTSLQPVGPMLNVSLPSHVGAALVSVDREKIGLIQSLSLELDVDSFTPKGTVKIVQYDPASAARVKLLQSVPWLKVEVVDYTAQWEASEGDAVDFAKTMRDPPKVALAPTPEQFKEAELSNLLWGIYTHRDDAMLHLAPKIDNEQAQRFGYTLLEEFRGTSSEARAHLQKRAERRKKDEESAKGHVRQEDDSDYRAE